MKLRISTLAVPALCVLFTAAGAAVTAGPAAATAISGGCEGGHVQFMSDTPIGLEPTQVTARLDGDLHTCVGTPTEEGGWSTDFVGEASCLGVNGKLDATFNWANGEVSRLVGPFALNGYGAPATNTLQIVEGPGSGGTVVITTGPIEKAGGSVTTCIDGPIRNVGMPVTGAQFA
ncbi:hypothetical protein FOH10_08090 [Nocardia otitidiscaviarum]|uniref:Secreted protein n=1 Tax=Nocardia otitidiscaviarum TaxID=1823 RepID=A0A516NIH1_9NOCA|nr:hypothetical protein [Nocardia otitidiscaviarum]MCP9619891.1 hypothetical protein [Nocardia otitidiscaviarum]QDP78707.1 hypothetical protein FOH10_08090 [Nocardia otitidiscaviarum]